MKKRAVARLNTRTCKLWIVSEKGGAADGIRIAPSPPKNGFHTATTTRGMGKQLISNERKQSYLLLLLPPLMS